MRWSRSRARSQVVRRRERRSSWEEALAGVSRYRSPPAASGPEPVSSVVVEFSRGGTDRHGRRPLSNASLDRGVRHASMARRYGVRRTPVKGRQLSRPVERMVDGASSAGLPTRLNRDFVLQRAVLWPMSRGIGIVSMRNLIRSTSLPDGPQARRQQARASRRHGRRGGGRIGPTPDGAEAWSPPCVCCGSSAPDRTAARLDRRVIETRTAIAGVLRTSTR